MSEPITLERIASQEDFAYFSRLAFNEDVMVPNMGRVFTQEEAEGYFAWLLEANRTCPESGCYKVFVGEDPAFIGLGSLWVREDGAEIDYMVLPDYWNRGYATAIAAELVNRARKIPGVTRVTALTDPANAASQRVLLKNGFAFEKTIHVEEDDSDADVYVLKL